MVVFGAVLLILILIGLIPIGCSVEYSSEGISFYLKIFFFKVKLSGKQKKESKKTDKKATEEKKPGSVEVFKQSIKPALKALGRLIRFLTVKRLVMNITLGGKDAFSTAMMYGGTAAAIGTLFPILDGNLKIRKKSISVKADFDSEEILVYVFADIRVFLGQLIATAICFVYQYLKKLKEKKGIESNG